MAVGFIIEMTNFAPRGSVAFDPNVTWPIVQL